jgi:nitrous oxidase accessory protein
MFKKNILGCILILFLCFLTSNVCFAEEDNESIIRVPDDYPSIEWAVGNATDGDTILVASGVYEENVVVDKSLKIVGESANTTIIDGGGYDWDNVTKGFFVVSGNVSIENFTVRNAYHGIYLENCKNITIRDNTLILNFYGISVNGTRLGTIQNNIATNNSFGIFLENSLNCLIKNNTATNNYGGHPDLRYGGGICLGASNNNTVGNNYLTKNLVGILIGESHNNTVIQNVVVENREPVYGMGSGIDMGLADENIVANNTIISDYIIVSKSRYNLISSNVVSNGGGIGTGESFGNMFYKNVVTGCDVGFTMEKAHDFFIGNLIVNNTQGINIHFSNGSTFYHNVLINNTVHVPKDVYPNVNIWDNGFEGNYWSNYTGEDSNMNAIGDNPHRLDELNMDRFPLMAPINIFDAGTWNNTKQQIHIISNSTITNFQLNKTQAKISFNVTSETPTIGFCRITIPNTIIQDMWNSNYTVLVDKKEPLTIKNWTDNTNTYIYFTYQHSQHKVTIIPEFSSIMLLSILILTTILYVFLKKPKH